MYFKCTFTVLSLFSPVDLSLAVSARSDGGDLLNTRSVLPSSKLESFPQVVETDQGGAVIGPPLVISRGFEILEHHHH